MLFCFSTLAGFARSSLVSDFLFEANLRSRDFQCCIIVNTDGFSTRRQAKHTVKACHGEACRRCGSGLTSKWRALGWACSLSRLFAFHP